MGSVYLRAEDQLAQRSTLQRKKRLTWGGGEGKGVVAGRSYALIISNPTAHYRVAPLGAVLHVGLCSWLSFAFSFNTELSPWELVRRALAGGGASRTFLILYGWPSPHIPGNLSAEVSP